MKTPRAVIFDFGGVLGISPMGFIARLADASDSTVEVMLDAVFGTHGDDPDNPWHAAERGEMALASSVFAAAMAERFAERGARYDHDWFVSWVASSNIEPEPLMVELAVDVRRSGRPIAMLTNSVAEFRPVIERTVDVGMFDVVVDSCAVGLRKPVGAIYELAAAQLEVGLGECFFLDDFAANVAGAEAVGMPAFHVTDVATADAYVRNLLDL